MAVGERFHVRVLAKQLKHPQPADERRLQHAARASALTLTGLKGTQAPRARSWKSGYIIKTTRDVVVSPGAGVKLQDGSKGAMGPLHRSDRGGR
jgi:hypothetical protein